MLFRSRGCGGVGLGLDLVGAGGFAPFLRQPEGRQGPPEAEQTGQDESLHPSTPHDVSSGTDSPEPCFPGGTIIAFVRRGVVGVLEATATAGVNPGGRLPSLGGLGSSLGLSWFPWVS